MGEACPTDRDTPAHRTSSVWLSSDHAKASGERLDGVFDVVAIVYLLPLVLDRRGDEGTVLMAVRVLGGKG